MCMLVVLSVFFWWSLAVSITTRPVEASCSVDSLVWTCKGPGLLPLDLLQPDKLLGITYVHGDMFCENARVTGYDGLISLAGWNSYQRQAYIRVTESNAYYLTLDMRGWMTITSSIDLSAGFSRIQLGEDAILQGYLHSLL